MFCRRTGHNFFNIQFFGGVDHPDADADIFKIDRMAELSSLILVEVLAVGIVEGVHHAVYRSADQCVLIDSLHIILLQILHNFVNLIRGGSRLFIVCSCCSLRAVRCQSSGSQNKRYSQTAAEGRSDYLA
ncbi:hypothetical protein D3C73_634100 [compost metagenome]